MKTFTSRRRFVATLGSATATMILRPAALQSASLAPLSFVIVTDTHLGKGDSLNPEQLWQKTALEMEAAPGAFILHLGDIVDGMREPQYARYLGLRHQGARFFRLDWLVLHVIGLSPPPP